MPIERVAVLADIHGNLPALEAVLREVEAARPDRIVLDGDLVDGPLPDEIIYLVLKDERKHGFRPLMGPFSCGIPLHV